MLSLFFMSGEDGIFYQGKIGAGTYYLEEITVPDGYNAPPGMFILRVTENGVTIGSTAVIGDLSDWITTPEAGDGEEMVYTVSLRNTVGYELPSTGGPGTNLIYLIGTILTAVAGTGLVMRKRRKTA